MVAGATRARKRRSYRSVVAPAENAAWERRARSNESTETINSPARALEERRDAATPAGECADNRSICTYTHVLGAPREGYWKRDERACDP